MRRYIPGYWGQRLEQPAFRPLRVDDASYQQYIAGELVRLRRRRAYLTRAMLKVRGNVAAERRISRALSLVHEDIAYWEVRYHRPDPGYSEMMEGNTCLKCGTLGVGGGDPDNCPYCSVEPREY